MVTDVTKYNLDLVGIEKAWLTVDDKHEEWVYVFNRAKVTRITASELNVSE